MLAGGCWVFSCFGGQCLVVVMVVVMVVEMESSAIGKKKKSEEILCFVINRKCGSKTISDAFSSSVLALI